ncbi:hypothetical protein [Photobacterium sp. DNB22_13_2]
MMIKTKVRTETIISSLPLEGTSADSSTPIQTTTVIRVGNLDSELIMSIYIRVKAIFIIFAESFNANKGFYLLGDKFNFLSFLSILKMNQ